MSIRNLILEGLHENRVTKSGNYVIEEKEKYSKEDLVEFLKWNSNAPVSILKKASIKELENFITRCNAWDNFFKQLPQNKEIMGMDKQVRTIKRQMGIK